jgi:hypothetical protein
MSTALLKSTYDSGLKTTGSSPVTIPAAATLDATHYCLKATGKNTYYFAGPGGEVTKVDAAHDCP